MPSFGKRSQLHLNEAHPFLRAALLETIKEFDFSIICGYRGREEQEAARRKGTSKAHFGQSAHNYHPCLSVDCIPYPFSEKDWENDAVFRTLADHFFSAADRCRKSGAIPQSVKFRWGGGLVDGKPVQGSSFNWDQPHLELHPWQDYRP